MEYIISLTYKTIIIYAVLMVCIRIMGKRQIGELEVSEFISTLLLSEIAAIPIAERSVPITNAIFPLITIILIEIIISYLATKSRLIKKIADGTPTVIMSCGRLDIKALKKSRITVDELISELRVLQIADISLVDYVILEVNGKISAFTKSSSQDYCGLAHILIIDGSFNYSGLRDTGISASMIESGLSKQGINRKEVFILSRSDDSCFTLMLKKDGICQKIDIEI